MALKAVEPFAQKPRAQWSLAERTVWAGCYVLVLRSLLNFIGLRRCSVPVSSGAPIAPEMLRFFLAGA